MKWSILPFKCPQTNEACKGNRLNAARDWTLHIKKKLTLFNVMWKRRGGWGHLINI